MKASSIRKLCTLSSEWLVVVVMTALTLIAMALWVAVFTYSRSANTLEDYYVKKAIDAEKIVNLLESMDCYHLSLVDNRVFKEMIYLTNRKAVIAYAAEPLLYVCMQGKNNYMTSLYIESRIIQPSQATIESLQIQLRGSRNIIHLN